MCVWEPGGHSEAKHTFLGPGPAWRTGAAEPRLEPPINLRTRRRRGKRALPHEAWASGPAVDAATEAPRCLGAGETPLGLPVCGEGPRGASVTMSVLDALWEDRDVRFDVSPQ